MGVRKTEVRLVARPRSVKARGVSAVQATLFAIDLQDVVNQLDASSCPPLSLGGNWVGVLSLPPWDSKQTHVNRRNTNEKVSQF